MARGLFRWPSLLTQPFVTYRRAAPLTPLNLSSARPCGTLSIRLASPSPLVHVRLFLPRVPSAHPCYNCFVQHRCWDSAETVRHEAHRALWGARHLYLERVSGRSVSSQAGFDVCSVQMMNISNPA